MQDIKQFTVATYNICGSEHECMDRLRSFLALIQKEKPDIVFVQEGTRLVWETLLREMGNMGYKKAFPKENREKDVGEMIFSKWSVLQQQYNQFKHTRQRRGLLKARVELGTKTLVIATSQLESGTDIASRREQIKSLDQYFRNDTDNVIFGGDMGILSYHDLHQPQEWVDAWYEAGSDESRFTINSEVNFLSPPNSKDRPDQVWYRHSIEDPVDCIECRLIGDKETKTISGHFGVMTKFKFRNT